MCTNISNRQLGFTLAELLVVLLIIGEISAFSIPKIIFAAQQQNKTAIFKETLGAISYVFYEGFLRGDIRAGTNGSYILSHMNSVKLCNTNANTEGCWPQSGAENTEPGMVLHNGATVGGLVDNGGTYNGFIMDWNGPAGTNTQGDDQMYLYMCYGSTSCVVAGSTIKPGTIGPGGAANIALYQSIFQ